jgi:hypothetical protein
MRLMRVLSGFMVIGTLGVACDDERPHGNDGEIEFRRGESCHDTPLLVSTSKTFKSSGHVNPMDMKPLALDDDHLRQIESDVIFALSAGFVANDAGASLCKETCMEAGLSWSGRGCVGELDIAFGEGEPLEATDTHPAMVLVPVDARASMGCMCR